MSTRDFTSDRPQEDAAHLDADLRAVDAALHSLGETERGQADQELVDRIMQASLPVVGRMRTLNASLSELGAMERASGPRTLEQDVFLSSRDKLRELTDARVHAVDGGRRAVVAGRRLSEGVRWRLRVAAVFGLSISAGLAVWAVLRPGGGGVAQPERTPESLSAEIRGEMDLLFAVLDDRSSGGEPAATDSGTDVDAQSLVEWLSEGVAS